MALTNTPTFFYAKDRAAWRAWLAENHVKEQSTWLQLYKKDADITSVSYSEAVDEALCFGWIDSTVRKHDAQSRVQFFCKRKPKSNWSAVNKRKVADLIAQNLMTEAGLKMVEIAKETGTWTASDEVENLIIPDDLQVAFSENEMALGYFTAFSRSAKKMILAWLLSAKRPETRQKRIAEIVAKAAENKKAYSAS